MFIYQINEVTALLTKEGVTGMGILLTVCALLIWDKVRQEKKYGILLDKYEKELLANQKVLMELVKNTTEAINNMANVYEKRN